MRLRTSLAARAVLPLMIMIAASGASYATASRSSAAQPVASSVNTGSCDSLATCYSPAQLREAYGIQPLTDRGIDGQGQTVVLPELAEQTLSPGVGAASVTNIRQDLAGFDKLFHLPAVRLQVSTALTPGASRWLSAGEETLDVEMIHAVAPAAAIRVLLFNGSAVSTPEGFAAAVTDLVRFSVAQHGDVISISAARGEHCFTGAEVTQMNAALRTAASRHVTVVASSGDVGPVGSECPSLSSAFTPVREVSLPASDPFVLAVGGTSLDASHKTGAYRGETGWGPPNGGAPGTTDQASGGGFSHLFARPSYQSGIPGVGTARGVPDVAADANGNTGMALAISMGSGKIAIGNSGGTSASAPFWAATIALADQYAGRSLGFVNPALYAIARGPWYHAAFHDITKGNNTVTFPPKTFRGYTAGPGWDPVTGLGSPNARVLIPLLVHYACR
jgi:subtilase family serine protease